MNRETKIIAGFPGVGKTKYLQNLPKDFNALDSDSSKYSWVLDEKGNKVNGEDGKPMRNPNFIKDYMAHIKSQLGKQDVIFISTHGDVQKALTENNINYSIVYPSLKQKEQWINRLRGRNDTGGLNNEGFLKLVHDNYENWIDAIQKDEFATKFELPYKGINGISDTLIKDSPTSKLTKGISVGNEKSKTQVKN